MRVVVIEDYPAIARSLERQLRSILGERITSVQFASTLGEAKAVLDTAPVDLLLLDLNLGGNDGFEVLQWATAGGAHTIIVSANTHRAIEAFEHGVLDFVPKPVDPQRLRSAIERYDGRHDSARTPTRHLSIRVRKGYEVLALQHVRQIRAAGKYSEVVLTDGRALIHEKSLERLEAVLPDTFVRVHRSHIINLGFSRQLVVQGGGRYHVEMDDGERIPVGRTRYAALRERLP